MSYEIYQITQGTAAGACALVGKGPHEGTLRHIQAPLLDEIVSTARCRAREGGFKVKREQLLLEPENKDGPEVQRFVAERLDALFLLAHHERQMRDLPASAIETRSAETEGLRPKDESAVGESRDAQP